MLVEFNKHGANTLVFLVLHSLIHLLDPALEAVVVGRFVFHARARGGLSSPDKDPGCKENASYRGKGNLMRVSRWIHMLITHVRGNLFRSSSASHPRRKRSPRLVRRY